MLFIQLKFEFFFRKVCTLGGFNNLPSLVGPVIQDFAVRRKFLYVKRFGEHAVNIFN